ncbi:MAG: branched-chain amino acid ABC transporter permease [Alphaproteobacteria bacterium]|nr:branched-chain amino acid ABC transporter permease [Alphaproteobacteria bacterium]
MRFIFKTDYNQDIRLFKHEGTIFWYGMLGLVLLVAPFALPEFYVGELASVFIYAIAGVGLMLLVGFTGQVSLGHAAFLGIGAYCNAYLQNNGVPFVLAAPAAGMLSGIVGFLVGLPALRMTGIYLAIATLAFAQIIEQVFIRWESVTGGFAGFPVPKPTLFGAAVDGDREFYFVCLVVLVLVIVAAINLLRSPTGRAWVAIRDSEIAAQSMGVNLAIYKTSAFGISAFFTGIAGALFAHKISYLAPDIFTILLSIQLLLMVVVGGLGSLHGAIYGAVFVVLLPLFISIMRDYLPANIARQPGLEPGLFGLILVLVILFEPMGIYGRWLKIKLFFSLFPLYKRATFKRQKTYMKSERLR